LASAPVDWEPLAALPPDQPLLAEHAVAFFADQVRVELPPEAIVLGLALRLTVGASDVTDTVADWLALCPEPEHVSV
jgi:hypothetical protein